MGIGIISNDLITIGILKLKDQLECSTKILVDDGIKLGSMLGKKLQVRGEDRTTVFNRQKVGRIDKRMISSLGFGNENVFQFTEVDSYKKELTFTYQ